MIPLIAIVGRPNVGKSTLFNCLTQSRQALVMDQPGVTRDRQCGHGNWQDKSFLVVDTGGIGEGKTQDLIDQASYHQAIQALGDADLILFVVDARQGFMPSDADLAKMLRKQSKPMMLVINKVDGLNIEVASAEFYRSGFTHQVETAASHNRGIHNLLEKAFALIPEEKQDEFELEPEYRDAPKVAIIGRPNVGKSTLVNRLLGEERVIVCDRPGTTRDSIYVPLERMGKNYTLIDTAGVRRKSTITDTLEKFSVIKTFQAIKDAHVCIMVFDAKLGLTDQDLTLLDLAIEEGSGLIIVANKWDGLADEDKENVKKQLVYRLKFAHFAPRHFISALHGSGVGNLFPLIDQVFASVNTVISTTDISDILQRAVRSHEPPLVKGRRIKLRYAHCGGHNPLKVVIHGNQTEELPQSYQRYLSKFFMKALKLVGTPVKIICKTGENPYEGKRNILTPRQIKKRERLMNFVKKHAKRRKKG